MGSMVPRRHGGAGRVTAPEGPRGILLRRWAMAATRSPLGQLVHLVDVAAPGLPEPLVSSGTWPIGVDHQTADQAGSASTTAPW